MQNMINKKNIVFKTAKFVFFVLFVFLWFAIWHSYSSQELDILTEKDLTIDYTAEQHSASNDVEDIIDDQVEDLDGERNEFKMKFQRLCISDINICSKIKFEWDYEYQDKYTYLATTMYILNTIDKKIEFGRSLKHQLDKIVIKNNVGARRWYATWDEIVVNLGTVRSNVEFFDLITHEVWHIVDLGMVRGFDRQKSKIYTEFGQKVFEIDDPSLDYYKISWNSETVRKAGMSREDFCSGYGMTDPFEDFAECHNWYLNHNSIFKKLAKENENLKDKYNFFANLYGWFYLFDAEDDLDKIEYNKNWRPWDTTRM